MEVEIKSSPDEEKGFKVTGGYWKFFRKIFDQKEKTYFMQANSATVLKELPKGSRFNFGSL